MKINRVILENYGVYRGHNVLNLGPRRKNRKQHPIILFGGKNGTGKTTLLDAIRLGLYGKASLGSRITQRSYEEHLRDLIHTSKALLIQPDSAKIGIEFDFVLRGDKVTYYIERTWSTNGTRNVLESFKIRKKNSVETQAHESGFYLDNAWPLLTEIESEHWEAFVVDIVPERLSQLFFFDGEKIKRIAEDLTSTSAVESAINSLLGLDLVKRLQADLSIYKSREAKKFAALPGLQRMNELGKKQKRLEEGKALLLGEKIPEKQKQVHEVSTELRRCETRLYEEGSIFASQRELKNQQKAVLEQKVEQLVKQIRSLCEGAFPLSLATKWSYKLLGQLSMEKAIREHRIVSRELSRVKTNLLKALREKDLISKDIKLTIEEEIKSGCDTPPELKGMEVIHRLSENDHALINSAIAQARNQSEEMKQMTQQLEQAISNLHKIEADLQRAPQKETLRPLFDQYQRIAQKLAKREAEKHLLEQELSSVRNDLSSCEREIACLEDEAGKHKAARGRFGLIDKINKASVSYLEQVTDIKIRSLRHSVTGCFNLLARKGDLLGEITIDPKTFKITVYDNSGRAIPREKLSAGEKQILAISILWGLAQTSGRPLPVIIDTPLGRLDSDHRLNLIRNYFPNASHQVILLSTDTEVDQHLFSELKPSISHCYHLDYDMVEGRTLPKEGYFWTENK